MDTNKLDLPETFRKHGIAATDALQRYLGDCESCFNHQIHMLGRHWEGPGYHTRVPNGVWVHPTRESLDYALALLHSNEPPHHERAADILQQVLGLQDTDPTSRTYGIWPWLWEESLQEMDRPDWNWADFCGARLAHVVKNHLDQLPEHIREPTCNGLRHAAWSIFRRNMGPHYTNIALMGSGVALAAGELLEESALVAYGRRRLEHIVAHTQYHGGFNEYNSPTYTVVALIECERILALTQDEFIHRQIHLLLPMIWQMVGEHFHPPTQQWAGPHSRNYADRLGSKTINVLSDRTGQQITPHPESGGEDSYSKFETILVSPQPCPERWRSRFAGLSQPEEQIVRTFVRSESRKHERIGTTWMDSTATLGSINHETFWTQRRPLIGYWRTEQDPAVVFRLRVLRDGQDFASAGVRQVQQGPCVLCALQMYTDRGDWHISADRPGDGVFMLQDLRLRYELQGRGVTCRQMDESRYELAAGEYRAIVHTAEGWLGRNQIRWELHHSEQRVYLDAVIHHGETWPLKIDALENILVAGGLELRKSDEPCRDGDTLSIRPTAAPHAVIEWPGTPKLEMKIDTRPISYD